MGVATLGLAAAAFLLGIRPSRRTRAGAREGRLPARRPRARAVLLDSVRHFAVPELERLGFVRQALGLSMPESVLLQAHEIIE